MTTKAAVQDFLAQRTLAVVGLSRDPQSFSASAAKTLRANGYRLFPVNRNATTLNGEPCYPSLSALPEPVGGVIVMVSPAESEAVVRDAAAAGIRRVWLQQNAESDAALRAGEELGLTVIANECILMFAEPCAWFHRLHRWVKGVQGKLPA